ncbi:MULTISPECIES: ATP-binding protein [unclassified Streptomyces]|uniref:ATP-binding protein n=1 Tax=unclassified Streptomyces TaxID=2593676 RepID=UPI002E2A0C5E|nr:MULTISPECIES: ATP-binding protein [unclassified Streptomyces]
MTSLRLELLAAAKAVPEARRAVREHLGVPCPEVQLCVSELLTNVIKHLGEGTPVTLTVTHAPGRTRVSVTDPEPYAWLVVRDAGPDDENGRGLLLLDAVALRWGVTQGSEGKTVWCELESPHPHRPSDLSGRSAASP